MCEANAYLIKEGEEKLLMKSVDVIEPVGDDSFRLVDIFGDQIIINGHIQGMSLVNHKILFVEN